MQLIQEKRILHWCFRIRTCKLAIDQLLLSCYSLSLTEQKIKESKKFLYLKTTNSLTLPDHLMQEDKSFNQWNTIYNILLKRLMNDTAEM